MKQILQSLGSGETVLTDVPRPALKDGWVLIRTECSLVSLGTERMLVEFGRSGWIEKARRQPEKVRQVFDKVRTDGLFSTLDAVRSKLDQPIPLGYSNCGIVMESSVSEFAAGDRVVSNGPHAEVVTVPRLLCAKVPDGVPPEAACFTVVASVGLQGLRLLQPALGECIAVIGLGLIGLLAVQLIRAHGASVIGIDPNPERCRLATEFGARCIQLSEATDVISSALRLTGGRGVDGVLICASTASNDPVRQAAQICRKRGRVVLVGSVGLELSRADFYEKELQFQVSCSYGPGRYDESYEQEGIDYPFAFVRWTEQRNFEAVLELLQTGALRPKDLISHRIPFKEAARAYADDTLRSGLAIVLNYDAPAEGGQGVQISDRTLSFPIDRKGNTGGPSIALIGPGNFSSRVLLPALQRTGARLRTIVSSGGVTGAFFGKKFGFEVNTTDLDGALSDPEVDTAFITTRHSTHARMVIKALELSKRVYVEKPLCVTREELTGIRNLCEQLTTSGSSPFVMVGFNRRFSHLTVKAKELLAVSAAPKSAIITVNAGYISDKHWSQAREEGGRIIGEACHFIDLLRFLIGHPISRVQSTSLNQGPQTPDIVTFTLSFTDGSVGTVHYFANGHKAFPKERVEVFCDGRILELNNFKSLTGYGFGGFRNIRLWKQDKGHANEMSAVVEALRSGGSAPIPLPELLEVTRTAIDVLEMLESQAKHGPV